VPIIGMRKIIKPERLKTKDAGITHRRCNLFQGEKRKMIEDNKYKSTCSTVTIQMGLLSLASFLRCHKEPKAKEETKTQTIHCKIII
jgi:hypothetical protein